MNGRARLLAWMNRAGLNQREAAREIGLHFTHLNKILSGYQTPGLRNALLIEGATGIPVESWLPTSVGKTETRSKSFVKNARVA